MKVIINNNERELEARHITIEQGDVEFRIKINHIGELEVQKTQYGTGESALIIKPNVSNEVRLS